MYLLGSSEWIIEVLFGHSVQYILAWHSQIDLSFEKEEDSLLSILAKKN